MGLDPPDQTADISPFTLLERCSFTIATLRVILPSYKLKHLEAEAVANNPFTVFPLDCAEQIVFVFFSRGGFLAAKARRPPPPPATRASSPR